MIKRTLYFGNPAYLSMRNAQLVVRLPAVEKNEELSEGFKQEAAATIPIEDIGLVLLDDRQITITQALLDALLQNNAAVITCNEKRMPAGLLLPLEGHSTHAEQVKHQLEASVPLKKQLWSQIIDAKISNQAVLLTQAGIPTDNMYHWANAVKSGDAENHEARAAAYYWKHVFNDLGFLPEFYRGREGESPNHLLNYGYAILRAITARALTGAGLLPVLGLFHSNKYNAFALADDIMEPYRPWVDKLVKKLLLENGNIDIDLTKDAKATLLSIATMDVQLDGQRSPLMLAVQRTSTSLAKCFRGESRKLLLPEWIVES